MRYMKVELLVGVRDEEANWDCGCDQTFALVAQFHDPNSGVYLIDHTRGFIDNDEAEKLKTSVVTEEGGI